MFFSVYMYVVFVCYIIKAHVHITTRWILGKGPCGPDCNIKDIGRSTLDSRKQQESLHSDISYFGNFSTTQTQGTALYVDILNDVIVTTMSESVVAVDEVEKWEEDSMAFSFLFPHKTTEASRLVE